MKTRWYILLGLVILILAQVFATRALVPERKHMVSGGVVIEALGPGEVAGTLMLGGFRGVASDILWMRASMAKEQKRFYESVALFDVISQLQPQFVIAWEYMAWDLAYNIAHDIEGEEGKMAWFVKGLEAAVQGSRRNPDSERMMRQLAWMLFHKGDYLQNQVERYEHWDALLQPAVDAHHAFLHEQSRLLVEALADTEARARIGDEALDDLLTALKEQLPRELDDARRASLQALMGEGHAPHYQRLLDIERLPTIQQGPVYNNFELSIIFYRAASNIAAVLDDRLPGFVRRQPAIAMRKDGHRLRNRGQLYRALPRYLAALREWDAVLNWVERMSTRDWMRQGELRSLVDSYQRNEGELRRKAATYLESIARDQQLGNEAARAMMERRFDVVEDLLADASRWRQHSNRNTIRWLDRPMESPDEP